MRLQDAEINALVKCARTGRLIASNDGRVIGRALAAAGFLTLDYVHGNEDHYDYTRLGLHAARVFATEIEQRAIALGEHPPAATLCQRQEATIETMKNAPHGAHYVWRNIDIAQASRLAHHNGRSDLQIVSCRFLDNCRHLFRHDGMHCLDVVLDPTVSLNAIQRSNFLAWQRVRHNG